MDCQVNNLIPNHYLIPALLLDTFSLPFNIKLSASDLEIGYANWDGSIDGINRGVQFERRVADQISRKISALGLSKSVRVNHINGDGEQMLPVDIIIHDIEHNFKWYIECKTSIGANNRCIDLSRNELCQMYYNANMIYVKGNFHILPNGKATLGNDIWVLHFDNPRRAKVPSNGRNKQTRDMMNFLDLHIVSRRVEPHRLDLI